MNSLFYLSFLLQTVPGVPKITDGYNPATWMLEVSSNAVESQLDVDFAEIYSNSDLYRYVKDENSKSHNFFCNACISYRISMLCLHGYKRGLSTHSHLGISVLA